jgi:type IV pilus assembly protein PilY1
VQTFTIDVDEGGDGTIRQGKRGSALYLAAKYGGFVDTNNDGNPFKASGGVGQPDTFNNSEWADGLDDDGQPKPANYFLASKPDLMIAAIRKVFQKAATSSGTTAGGSISGNRVTSSGASVYVPQFSSARWSGTLLSYALTYDSTAGTVNKSAAPSWDAGAKLTGNPTASPAVAATSPSSRNVYTQLSSGTGVAFQWTQLDATLQGYLNASPYTSPAASDTSGSDRLDYLRGDRTKEVSVAGGLFRKRDSVMGDVVNSGPLFVGAPTGSVRGPGYAAFATTNKNRQQAVYVGANDGMLHAFAADTGVELFAYVPRAVLPNLGAYTSPSYAHQPYVDGSPVAGEAQMSDSSWKTVLVSGTGGGAPGVFALDVTNPAAFSAGKVMWEFTRADDTDMGYVTQSPRIMKFRTALATQTSAATYGWFAVVPSGFNNANADKRAALFLLSLDKAPNAAWVRGTNYYKVMLPTPAVNTMVNALSTPGDYAATDGSTRFLYAGDTQGNMWKFDFTKAAPWSETNALGLSGKPLITAKDASGNRQPITIAPEVGVGPNGGAILLFGTGKFVETDDLSNYKVQTMYGVLDTNGTASETAIPENQTRVQLQKRLATVDGTGQKLATIAGDAFAYGKYSSAPASRRGWYFDFPGSLDQGERQISKVSLSDGFLVFNTLIPNANVCGAGGGGRSCAVNATTGLSQGSTCVPSTIGLLSAPILIQEGEGAYSASDAFGRRSETKKLSVINLGTGSGAGGAGVSITRPIGDGKVSQVAGRLNWRNVTNYKDVKP